MPSRKRKQPPLNLWRDVKQKTFRKKGFFMWRNIQQVYENPPLTKNTLRHFVGAERRNAQNSFARESLLCKLAQRGGFEPPEHFCSPVFETGTFDHSDISASEFIITLSAKFVKRKFASCEKCLTNKYGLTIILLLNLLRRFI